MVSCKLTIQQRLERANRNLEPGTRIEAWFSVGWMRGTTVDASEYRSFGAKYGSAFMGTVRDVVYTAIKWDHTGAIGSRKWTDLRKI